MTITISHLTVAASAPAGTIVGVLTARNANGVIPCNFILSNSSSLYFAVSSNNLVTTWSGSIAPGYYPVRVRAVGINTLFAGFATFSVNVIAPSLPTPTGVTFVTKTTLLTDNSPAGTTIATFSVSMSDGSAFAGTLGASPTSTVAISGSTQLVLARGLTSADDGSQQQAVSATQNGVTVSSSITVQVTRATPPPPPRPTGVTLTPSTASLPDNPAAGTVVAAVSVSMSDGSAFAGSLAASPTWTVTISGKNLVLARALTSAGNGMQTWIAAATQNGVTVSGSITVQATAVSPPPPPPPPPSPNSPDGTVITAPNGALTTSQGTWTFGTSVADSAGDYATQLNGTTNGLAVKLQITNGNVYAFNQNHGDWYLWSGTAWSNIGTTAPVEYSPDGTVITAPNGTLTTSQGTWSFATSVADSAGDYATQLNGTANGLAVKLQITNGNVYAFNQNHGDWYLWSGTAWSNIGTTPPVEGTPPTPTAITLSPGSATVPDNAPAGTLVATANVTMSDGSQFAGTLTTSNTNLFAISGMQIVTVRALTSADDGTQSTVITASQGSQSLSREFSI